MAVKKNTSGKAAKTKFEPSYTEQQGNGGETHQQAGGMLQRLPLLRVFP